MNVFVTLPIRNRSSGAERRAPGGRFVLPAVVGDEDDHAVPAGVGELACEALDRRRGGVRLVRGAADQNDGECRDEQARGGPARCA